MAHPARYNRLLLFAGVLTLFLLGLCLRFDSIDASLWLDEFGTLWVVEGDFSTMLHRCWRFQGQSPLYYVLPWISIHLVGESEVALRAPSLVLCWLYVAVLYSCARTLAGPRAGFYAAALA